MRLIVTLLIALLTCPAMPHAAELLTVTRILAGDRIILSDNRIIRLEAVSVPAAEPFATAARNILQNYIGTSPVTLAHTATNRYGDTVATVTAQAAKLNAEAMLVKAGAAFIFPPLGTEAGLPQLFTLEREARAAHRGLWADPAYADLSPDDADDALGRFAFVRGMVLDAARVKDKFYLNFGSDWHDDFTVAIAVRDLRLFIAAGIDPVTLKGKIIRVRGVVTPMFGPMIVIDNPAQLEILIPSNAQ